MAAEPGKGGDVVIAYIVIGFLLLGIIFLVGNLVMMRRENQQLQEDLSQAIPGRDYVKPFVPEPWRPADDDLRDPTRPNPAPTDPYGFGGEQ